MSTEYRTRGDWSPCTFKDEFHYSRAALCLPLLAEVLRVELCRVRVEALVVVDPRHVDVQHVTLLQGDFRARYPERYSLCTG